MRSIWHPMSAGSNASYVEDMRRITKIDFQREPLSGTMVINIEWSEFSPNAYRLLSVDRELDAASLRPGEEPFEKLTGYLYLGEITSRILLRSVCLQIPAHLSFTDNFLKVLVPHHIVW